MSHSHKITLEQLKESLEYWENGNPENYRGLCKQLFDHYDIKHDVTTCLIESVGIEVRENGFIGIPFDPEPRIEALKTLIKNHTLEQLKESLEYWENGNPENYNGLCQQFDVYYGEKASYAIWELLHEFKLLHGKILLGSLKKPEPRIKALKTLIKNYTSQ